MFPRQHLILGFVFSLFLLIIFPSIGLFSALIIVLSSVLIDVDHYLYYVFVKKNWSLPKAYRWFREKHSYWVKLSREERNKHKGCFVFLHGTEILGILFFLGFFVNSLFYYILIGFAFHLFLDIIYMRRYQDRLDRVSVIHDFIKFRKYECKF